MSSQGAAAPAERLHWGSAQGRWVIAAAVLGSGMAGIDATVVNVALPAIGADLDADFAGLQWVVTGYALTMASFILLGGSLGDRYGRARIYGVGIAWFALASLLCGVAPTAGWLVAARLLQGVGAALLTPASLSILQASFVQEDRGRAIGAWSGLGGVATAAGPFLGGWLVDTVSWRWVFLINLPVAALVMWIVWRHVPESRDPEAPSKVDLRGSLLAAASLAGATYALISGSSEGLGPTVAVAVAVSLVCGVGFVVGQRRSDHPLVPPAIFASVQFRAVNAVTFIVYGALGFVFFLLVLQLQIVSGFGPVAAGTALLPITLVMLGLSARSGDLAARIGPRPQMVAGPLICALALLWMLSIGEGADYVTDVLPPVLVFGLGLATMVAPLTSAALSAVSDSHAGVASGVNNAVARTGGLVAVAAVPALVGLTGGDYQDPAVFEVGFDRAMVVGSVMLALGALVSALTVRVPRPEVTEEAVSEREEAHCVRHCAVGGPPQVVRTEEMSERST